MERTVLDLFPDGKRNAKNFEGFIFGGGGKSKIAGIGEQLTGLHDAVDGVFDSLIIFFDQFRQRHVHLGGGAPALAGVGFVDDDGEFAAAVFVADFIQDEGEFLDGGDDDFLARFEENPQIAAALGVTDDGRHLGELLDRIADLAVQDAAVGDNDNRVKDRCARPGEPDELVSQPGDGIALAAAGGVLDEIAFADRIGGGIGQQLVHDVELVVTGKDLFFALFSAARILFFDHLGVIFDDIG